MSILSTEIGQARKFSSASSKSGKDMSKPAYGTEPRGIHPCLGIWNTYGSRPKIRTEGAINSEPTQKGRACFTNKNGMTVRNSKPSPHLLGLTHIFL